MQRLNAQTTPPDDVQSPGYDRSLLRPGIVHLGIGAFHRAHQAVYTDDALAHEFGNWGIIGASLRSTDIVHSLTAQDCLHSVVTRDRFGENIRIVGSTVRAIAAVEDRDALLFQLADPTIKIVTLTVSEKAYGIDPTTGGLDANHAAVDHDLADPHNPVGAIGLMVEGLARRHVLGHPPFTVLCCDNLPGNGRVVRRLVVEMASRRDPALGQWIDAEGRFPSSMVDRIVPAATEDVRQRAALMIGAEDLLALETEPFTQWVIEDSFVSGRPAWEAGGALFVEAVEPYEKMKLRLLNGSHSLIAYLGQLHGLEYVRDVMAVAEYRQITRQHMSAALPTLDPVPGIDLEAYIDQLIDRFANPAIAHRTSQIAMDGTQKLPQRIFAPASETIAAGRDADAFAYATALWIAYVMRTEKVDDPRAEELQQAVRESTRRSDGSAAFFDIHGLFPTTLTANTAWRADVERHLQVVRKA